MERAIQMYQYIFHDLADPRTKDWWLVPSPVPLLTILATYLYLCTKLGPKYMENRKPYEMKAAIMLYNIFQIILSTYITFMGLDFILTEKHIGWCYPVDYSNSPRATKWATAVWWFYFGKVTELLDTVFFVLRKKQRQISFLHLYHHTIMPIIGFIGVKYIAGGQSVAEGTVNGFIHMVMYTYYLISGLGAQYQKYLWWKKYLTTMQLIQFCIIIFLNVNNLFNASCSYPRFIMIIVTINCSAFFWMFAMFYYNSYVKVLSKINIRNQATMKEIKDQ